MEDMIKTTPYCIFKNNRLNIDSFWNQEDDIALGSADKPGDMSPLSIPLDPLLSSVVHVSRRSVREEKKTEQPVRCCISAWNEKEKARCIDSTHLWVTDSSCPDVSAKSQDSPLRESDACSLRNRKGTEEPLHIEDVFLKAIITESLWQTSSKNATSANSNGDDGKNIVSLEMLDVSRLQLGARRLFRLLRQHYDGNETTNESPLKAHSSLDLSNEEEEARRVFTIVTQAIGKRWVSIDSDENNEPFLVGLICREQCTTSISGGINVRPLNASEFVGSCDGKDGLVGVDCVDPECTLSLNVMLLEVNFAEGNVEEISTSSIWQTLLSVVDFVYVVGRPTIVSRVLYLIDVLCHATAKLRPPVATTNNEVKRKHFKSDCTTRTPVCPALFYSTEGDSSIALEHCPSRGLQVHSLQMLLYELGQIKDFRGLSCCKGVYQWSLLLQHVWFTILGSSDVKPVSPIQERIDTIVTATVQLYVATAELLLLAMRAMEPLPPLLVCGSSIGTISAAPRLFTLESALQIAYRVALLVYNAAVGLCNFDNCLVVARHTALQNEYCECRCIAARGELDSMCLLAAEALKKRLRCYTQQYATRVLRQSVTDARGKQTKLSIETTGMGKGGSGQGEKSLVCIIQSYLCELQNFLCRPLISHYSMDDENSQVKSVSGKHFRMVESPLTSLWAQEAKTTAVSEYVQCLLLPSLLQLAQERELVLCAKESAVSEARERTFHMEDHCIQLENRCKQAEAQIEHQQTTLRHVKRRNDILKTQLQDVCKCLQKLVMTYVGYEESRKSYTRKLGFRMKHSCVTSSAVPPSSASIQHPRREKNAGGMEALVVTPQKYDVCPSDPSTREVAVRTKVVKEKEMIIAMLDNNDDMVPLTTQHHDQSSSSSSSSSGYTQPLENMYRDAQLQLEACHNVLLCMYEDAYEMLRKVEKTTADCTMVGLHGFHQSLFSVPLRVARSTTPTTSKGLSVNVSMSDTASEAMTPVRGISTTEAAVATGAFLASSEALPRNTIVPPILDVNHNNDKIINNEKYRTTEVGVPTKTLICESNVSTHASNDIITTNRPPETEKEEEEEWEQGRQRHGQQECLEDMDLQRLYSSLRWTSTTPLLCTPERAQTAAVDAIAVLQQQRQDAMEGFARLQQRCEALEKQVDEQNAILCEARQRIAVKEENWCVQRRELQDRLDVAAEKLQLADERVRQGQQEVEQWALSWAEMRASIEAETRRVTSGKTSAHADDDDDGTDNNESGGMDVDGKKRKGKDMPQDDLCQFYVRDWQEALSLGRNQLHSLITCVHDATVEEQQRQRQMEFNYVREEVWKEAEEVQKQAVLSTTVKSSEVVARMGTEMNLLKETLAFAVNEKRGLRVKCDAQLAKLEEVILHRLDSVDTACMSLLDICADAMMGRSELILYQCWAMVSRLSEENCRLRGELELAQKESRRWEDAAEEYADTAHKTTTELVCMVQQIQEQEQKQQTLLKEDVVHLSSLLHHVFAAYVVSFDTWEQAMLRRCELLLRYWNPVLLYHPATPPPLLSIPQTAPSQEPAEKGLQMIQGKVDTLYDPNGYAHELRRKKRRVAELEEALRQKKVVCDSFKKSVAHLNALLLAQRELGMTAPPPAPFLSEEFGLLSGTDAATLVNGFYTSPGRLQGGSSNSSSSSSTCKGINSINGTTSTGSTDRSGMRKEYRSPSLHVTCTPAAQGVNSDPNSGDNDGSKDAVEPHPLGWYLQTLSAIESTLMQ